MTVSLEEVLASFSEEDRERIEARAAELVTLYELRKAVQKTQTQMAETLGVRQDSISRMENRSDMLLSTLRRYVEGMGGTLELVAQFPGRPPMVIQKLGETTAPQAA
ncbi:MAG: XRE family transcriptional regulator [Ottowia sp.]|nr:XRE family transcriptional regulator [Ottowia sp.]